MIQITPQIAIEESEIREEFIRSSGPGGQNVNKVATAVQLRFDVVASPSLPEEVRRRLLKLARGQINQDGILVINAQRFRTQSANRQDALDRLVELIRKATQKPRPRYKTKPTLASRERRLEGKRLRSRTKQQRSAQPENEE
jgi:ribosome-associated protein